MRRAVLRDEYGYQLEQIGQRNPPAAARAWKHACNRLASPSNRASAVTVGPAYSAAQRTPRRASFVSIPRCEIARASGARSMMSKRTCNRGDAGRLWEMQAW